MKHVKVLVLAGIVAVGFVAIVHHVQAVTCHQLTSANPVPAGFGASYSLFGNSSKMLLAGNCTSREVEVQAGNQDVSGLVYRSGYRWDGTRWSPLTFSGYSAGGSPTWLGNQGTANVAFPSSKIVYVAAYICEYSDGWKCGCRSTSQCSANGQFFWNLQKYDGTGIIDPIGGDDDDDVGGPQCGNGTCEGSETGASCSADCNLGGGGSGKYEYEFLPPSDIDWATVPIQVSTISGLSGTQYFDNPNDWNKILLIVMPNGVFTGNLSARGSSEFLKARGVVIIGGTWSKKGRGTKESPAGNMVAGGHYMQIKFDKGAPKRPFLWISNLDVASDGNYWGDFIKTGTAINASNPDEDEWVDLYFQKTKIRSGSYFFTSPGEDWDPHSDGFQPSSGGWRKLMFADLDLRWFGQTIFAQASNVPGGRIHSDSRIEIKDVIFRPMPFNRLVYPESGYSDGRKIWYFKTSDNGGGSVYTSTWLRNVYAEKKTPHGPVVGDDAYESLADYFEVYRASKTVSGNKVQFGTYSYGGRPPAVDGDQYVTFGEPSDPMVSDGEIGIGARVTTDAQLRSLFD